ncbi:LytTr DNA-binding domain protein [Aquimixticola soesokkakensis]|uniref:LytTr DNA-binding domain protein n=1 Tax=Aquimixticola soesokkakensis TaxID=1519096 RepID=A0A1Y5S4Y7_9RHOB|nr:LytTR family DNA-binding domain-containing protein [Aquimixticola soesokkakensis]SLN32695.1 LytTr DNA-binding domain protein [Aquimixticola soesokkakensis]
MNYIKDVMAEVTAPFRLFVFFVLTMVMGMSGPFGTFYDMPFAARLAYWAVMIAGAIVLGYCVRVALDRRFPQVDLVWRGCAETVLITLLYCPYGYSVTTGLAGVEGLNPDDIYFILPVTVLVCALLSVGRVFFVRAGITAVPRRLRLLERLSDKRALTVYHLTVDDHYVEVATNLGSERVLMRFADAVAELDGLKGAQVHRSHWVAHAAVRCVEKENGRHFLVLINGERVPVSRANQGVIEEAGWQYAGRASA